MAWPALAGADNTGAVDVTAKLEAPVSVEQLFPWVEDLSRYPRWLDIVPRAEPDGADQDAAWIVDLRGRLGPFARSKRLRMVRTVREPDRVVTFERRERDGRSHSPWVLTAELAASDDGSVLTMHLHYGGGLWGPVLERLLGDEIERSLPRLLALVANAKYRPSRCSRASSRPKQSLISSAVSVVASG
ncbi:MAG: hypothetical protein QOE63_616, partial [Acidimicrobiaceae bacterium]